MKAWLVREKDEFCAAVVFAETRGKAKSLAMRTEACEDAAFMDIEVRRMKEADKYYREGKRELNWFDDADRVALVKDCGFSCDPHEIPDWDYCLDCPAKEWCDEYQDRLNERSEGE